MVKKFFVTILLVLCGIGVGFINGFLGAGGGILVVPVLRYICKLEVKKAHATAVLIILPICVVSTILYILKQTFEFSIALPVGIGSVIGGVGGTFLLKKLKNEWIVLVFAVILILAGIKMIV